MLLGLGETAEGEQSCLAPQLGAPQLGWQFVMKSQWRVALTLAYGSQALLAPSPTLFLTLSLTLCLTLSLTLSLTPVWGTTKINLGHCLNTVSFPLI